MYRSLHVWSSWSWGKLLRSSGDNLTLCLIWVCNVIIAECVSFTYTCCDTRWCCNTMDTMRHCCTFYFIAVTCKLYREITPTSSWLIVTLPPNYENNESCSWKITAPAHKVGDHCIYWIVFVIAILPILFIIPILDAYTTNAVLSSRRATELNTDIERYTDANLIELHILLCAVL